jgi:hypothetical protein
MTNQELRELNKGRTIFQIAFLTRNLERSMQAWIDNLGIGPWSVYTFTDQTVKNLKVNGKLVTEPFKFLIGLCPVGQMEIEIIQPVYGPMIYDEYLNRRGEGLHHIKEKIADKDAEHVLAAYREKGIGVTQTGQFQTDIHWYLDTEPRLDFVYELGNCPPIEVPPGMVSIYPPENA